MNHPQGILPLLPLKNTVIFPGLTQILRVGREQSLKALKDAESRGFWIVTVQQRRVKDQHDAQISGEDLYTVGTLCRIDSIKGQPESGVQVSLKGVARVSLEDIHVQTEGRFLQANVTTLDDFWGENPQVNQALLEGIRNLSLDILKLVPTNTQGMEEMLKGIDDLSFMNSLVAGNLDLPLNEKQKLLETLSIKDRSLYLLNLMRQFKESLEIQTEIRDKFGKKINDQQRQALLREQMKTIQAELDTDDSSDEAKLRKEIEGASLPAEVKEIAEQELRRLKEIGAQSPEYHVIRNYLQTLAALPWSVSSEAQEINLEEASKILEADHYGLEKVKKRILQQLAVFKLRKSTKGAIILLVGPPGVGKTSLGQSIAKALGRKFARISLGGVRDDADIRGHRRTYVGAMPGRIITAMKRAKENNPVFMLDEIDKVSRGYGDPAAALLEVLDPEQNKSFMDHYLDVGFDLSNVLFICTANQTDSIPAPLLDRMEVIEVSGYTTAEKLHIAKKHLIPKQCDENGIDQSRFVFEDEAILDLISYYTREAGVRELQRVIGKMIQASSVKYLNVQESIDPSESKDSALMKVLVKSSILEEILGRRKYEAEIAEGENPAGIATGLAWSPVGGSILFIEATTIPGNGQMVLTGQLGEVMKESAQIAQSLVFSHLQGLGVLVDTQKMGLHLHIPAGAIPKDGPSAGIALFSALMSLFLQKSIAANIGMSGEITLRGRVNPVGGIKEKVIAAHRAGLKELILPAKNLKDFEDVPEDIRKELKVQWVTRIEEVVEKIFGIEVPTMGPKMLQLNRTDSEPLPCH